jgi:hypothetical protein
MAGETAGALLPQATAVAAAKVKAAAFEGLVFELGFEWDAY